MREPKTTSMIKATARERLLGRYGTTIGATLLFMAIQFIVSDIVISMINPDGIITFAIYILAVFLVDLCLGVLYSGVAYLYMNVIYAQPASVMDIFHGIKHHPDKALILQLPYTITSMMQSVPLAIIRNYYMSSLKSPFSGDTTLVVLLLIAAVGTVLCIAAHLMFALGYYLLQDFPDKSGVQLLGISRSLMQGNKLRLVKLYISFIPLFILGTVALFIPLLWVDSYFESSLAAFYQDRIALSTEDSRL